MTNVSITYCRPCGYGKQASDAARMLQKELALAAALVPGEGGIFEVRVDDKVVARRVKGHSPNASEIVKAVAAAIKAAPTGR